MYQVLIADDEYYVRLGLRSRVDWQSLGLRVAGEACNGLEALELMRKEQIDVLLTDVCMPEMDGFELIAGAKRLNPGVQCIILSGYDDFIYAKTALRLGVVNYIQKPLDDQELRETLQEAIRHLEDHKNLTRPEQPSPEMLAHIAFLKQQQTLSRLLRGHRAEEDKWQEERDMALILLHVNLAILPERLEPWIQESIRALEDEGLDLLGGTGPDMPLVVRFLMLGDSLSPELVRRTAEGLREALENHLAHEPVHGAFSGVIRQADALPGLYQDVMTALKSKLLYPDALLCPAMIRPLDLSEQNASVKTVMELREALSTRNLKQVQMLILALMTTHISHISTLETILRYLGDIIEEYRLRYRAEPCEAAALLSGPDQLLLFEDLDQMRHQLIPQILDYFFCNESFLEDRIVGQVQYYIRQNLSTDLKVSTLSKLFFLSPNYLSHLFRKETGYALSEFIENIRMERARALLSLSTNTVQEVARQVGYADAAHFSRVFRKATGRPPQRYQAEFRLE